MESLIPTKMLAKALNEIVAIRLKDGRKFKGRLSRVDTFMNLTLDDAELMDGDSVSTKYGPVFIRGNNILYIQMIESE